eukprot:CAMPEP_0182564250 /NCGR_PEP_ID=MMETSP1324-20130603/6226_1 /TAXON_ID=236786 /ORGANISM="Florenciella sp., Strain RCC1587" /LENGTH=82 /DNA_ID=CAMNT_0024777655 /DNA_START=328 /DNA_END=577 /DNA_ORIENTATION=+
MRELSGHCHLRLRHEAGGALSAGPKVATSVCPRRLTDGVADPFQQSADGAADGAQDRPYDSADGAQDRPYDPADRAQYGANA